MSPAVAEHFSSAATERQSRRVAAYWVAGLVILILVVGTVLQVAAQPLGKAGLIAVPQRFVALSFVRPTALPYRLAPGSPLRFDFEIANEAGAAITQAWEVTAVGSGGSTAVIEGGTERVGAGATATVDVSAFVPERLRLSAVDVSLPGRHLAPLEFHITATSRAVAP
jgi:hypothetical protein